MSTGKAIIKKYENHTGIINTNNKVGKSEHRYNIPLATAEPINKIIKKLNPYKVAASDKILPKIVILSANIRESHLANMIKRGLDNSFCEGAKIAIVGPIYKKSDIDKIENYRPVSILNCFSKVYERFLHEQFKPFEESLSQVLLQLIGIVIVVIMYQCDSLGIGRENLIKISAKVPY